MSRTEFDLVVVGGGPGGYVAAIRAAQLKLRTALVEKDRLGGICLNWGCIPTKALLKNAEVYRQFLKAKDWGFSCSDLCFDLDKIVKRSRDVANRLNKGIEFLLKKNEITFFPGTARLAKSNRVVVKGADGVEQELSTRFTCLATGARPRPLPGIDFDRKRILSYFEALVPKEIPKRLLVIGGGPIGLEFAFFYSTFGSKVTLFEMMPHILPAEDAEVAAELAKQLGRQGIKIVTEAKVCGVSQDENGVALKVSSQGEEVVHAGDAVLLAAGVLPNVESLGLEDVGITLEKGFIKVDRAYRTTVPGIFAIGDVVGPPMLAHAASAEGVVAAAKMAGLESHVLDIESIPSCTYTHPQVASVGLTEAKAAERGPVRVGRFPFRALGKAVAINEKDGFVKLVFDARRGTLLGAHLIGPEVTELIAQLGLGRALGATDADIHRTVHAHPTLAEAVMEAAADAGGQCIHS